jgi:precorrin-8X/cobalt-precorrin-8 methylmutase
MTHVLNIRPEDIEAESFRIIEAEFTEQTGFTKEQFTPAEFAILQRVVHATGDFSIASCFLFQNDGIARGIDAIRRGGTVLVDVNMVASGISKTILARHGGRVLCRLNDSETLAAAKAAGTTRTEAAMRRSKDDEVAIAAIGNAPTGLLAILNMVAEGTMKPDLIVGAPVGFVNAAESKELLVASGLPAIVVRGRRGGSPVAAAIINALLRLA